MGSVVNTYINIKPATIYLYILCTQISGSPKKRVKTAKSCLLYVNIVTLNKKANKGFACKNGLTLIFSKRSDLENIFLIFYHFGIFILHHTCQLYNMWQFSFYKKNFLDLIYLTNLLSVWSIWVVVHIFVYKEGKVISEPSGSSHIIINL